MLCTLYTKLSILLHSFEEYQLFVCFSSQISDLNSNAKLCLPWGGQQLFFLPLLGCLELAAHMCVSRVCQRWEQSLCAECRALPSWVLSLWDAQPHFPSVGMLNSLSWFSKSVRLELFYLSCSYPTHGADEWLSADETRPPPPPNSTSSRCSSTYCFRLIASVFSCFYILFRVYLVTQMVKNLPIM